MPNKMRLLLVTSNSNFAAVFKAFFEGDPSFSSPEVVFNNLLAIEAVKKDSVDWIILDYWMHNKNSDRRIKELYACKPQIPIIILDNSSPIQKKFKNSEELSVFACLERESDQHADTAIYTPLLNKIKELLSNKTLSQARSVDSKKQEESKTKRVRTSRFNADIFAIGSSTGGPLAVEAVLNKIPKNFPLPIVLTQHMPPVFTKSLAERLNSKCQIAVKEAENGETIQPGVCYIAPGNYHLTFAKKPKEVTVVLTQSELVNSCRPSVDVMLGSLTEIYHGKIIVTILTGMGADGAQACKKIKELGGYIAIQDKETSVVWGMPKAVFDLNVFDTMLPIEEMGEHVVQKIMGLNLYKV